MEKIMKYSMGIDIGTTSLKGCVFDENGVEVLDANQVQQKLYINTNIQLKAGDILRKKVEK